VGFEPDERSFRALENGTRHEFFNIGLYGELAEMDLYLTKRPDVSSILRPNQEFLKKFSIGDYFEVVGTKRIRTRTLDEVWEEKKITAPDFIQVDTQGSELYVLQGGKKLLNEHIFGVEVEVEFYQLYLDQPLFSDVDKFLQSLGFYLFDLRPQYFKRKEGLSLGNRKGQLLHADALYLKSTTNYLGSLNDLPSVDRRRKLFYAVMICLHYGYLDYAKEIVDESGGILDEKEKRLIVEWLKRCKSREKILPDFVGRGVIFKALMGVAKYLRVTSSSGRLRGGLGNSEID